MAGTPDAADALAICARTPLCTPPEAPTPAAAATPPGGIGPGDGSRRPAHSRCIVMASTPYPAAARFASVSLLRA